MGKSRSCLILVSAALAAGTASAKKPKEAWTVTQVTDPVTGISTCVVAAFDRFGKVRYSRMGYLYAIVENNAKFGLLVGVSSGGKYRLPTGDVLWRVDTEPFRTLRAAESPVANAPFLSLNAPTTTGNPVMDKAVSDAMTNAMKVASAYSATSTVAAGETARQMLREMMAGRSLLYRQAATAPAYGLPSPSTFAVGQYTSEGQSPIPLDDSFRRGIAQCGITNP